MGENPSIMHTSGLDILVRGSTDEGFPGVTHEEPAFKRVSGTQPRQESPPITLTRILSACALLLQKRNQSRSERDEGTSRQTTWCSHLNRRTLADTHLVDPGGRRLLPIVEARPVKVIHLFMRTVLDVRFRLTLLGSRAEELAVLKNGSRYRIGYEPQSALRCFTSLRLNNEFCEPPVQLFLPHLTSPPVSSWCSLCERKKATIARIVS